MSEKGERMEITSTDLLEQASVELWEMCTQAALDGFNAGEDGLTPDEFKQRIAEFTERLRKFQRDVFPSRSNATHDGRGTRTVDGIVGNFSLEGETSGICGGASKQVDPKPSPNISNKELSTSL